MHSGVSSTASTKATSSLRSKTTLWYKTNRDQRKPNGGHLQLKHAPNVSSTKPHLWAQASDSQQARWLSTSSCGSEHLNIATHEYHLYTATHILLYQHKEDTWRPRSSYKNNEMTTTCNANAKATQPKRDPAARNFQTLYNATLHIPSYELSVHKCNKSTPSVRKHNEFTAYDYHQSVSYQRPDTSKIRNFTAHQWQSAYCTSHYATECYRWLKHHGSCPLLHRWLHTIHTGQDSTSALARYTTSIGQNKEFSGITHYTPKLPTPLSRYTSWYNQRQLYSSHKTHHKLSSNFDMTWIKPDQHEEPIISNITPYDIHRKHHETNGMVSTSTCDYDQR